jgi:pimeloyl-ACP methyl ester carboxylesterase
MARAHANGIEIEYDTVGDPNDPPLLLVMGLGAQLISWDDELCKLLAANGRYVIRYDNRDCGLSTKHDGVQVDLVAIAVAAASGNRDNLPPVPYLLRDLAADGMGLLTALGIERADVMGASMGGMIVQQMAIDFPERVRTVTSIMSMTGEPEYGAPTPEAMQALLSPPPTSRQGYVDKLASDFALIGTQRYRDEAKLRDRAGRAYDRMFYPEGTARQLAAVVASGNRADGLRALRVPLLVLHGRDDKLVTLSGGERTAELVPGAHLVVFADMGHDLPEPLWPLVVDVVDSHLRDAIG